jgi:hypothetical protein
VAEEGVTVAVKVKLSPTLGVELETFRAVVVEVVLDEVLLVPLFVLELHPVLSIAARASAPRAIVYGTEELFILIASCIKVFRDVKRAGK